MPYLVTVQDLEPTGGAVKGTDLVPLYDGDNPLKHVSVDGLGEHFNVNGKADDDLSNVDPLTGREALEVDTRQVSVRGRLSAVDADFNVGLIQGLLDQGYVVVLPDDGGVYPINATLVIGDGTTSLPSTRSGGLVGAGGAIPYGAISTYLIWTGPDSPSTPFVRVNGMVYGLEIRGVGFNCNWKCSGIEILGMRMSHVEDSAISAYTKFAIKIIGRSGSAGQQIIQNAIKRNICETGGDQASHPIDACKALWLDGDYASLNDPWLNVFEGNRFVIGAAINSCARYLGFCDSNVFIRDHYTTGLTPGAGSTGTVYDATGHNGFPAGNHDVSTTNYPGCSVIETVGDKIRVNTFANYGTYDNETVPTHAMLRGVTDTGLVFNGGVQPAEADIQGSAWTAFSPTLSATVGTITTSTAGARYKKIGRTAHLNLIVGVSSVGSATTALLIDGIPAEIAPQDQTIGVAANNSTRAALYALMTSSPSRITVRTQAGAFPLANGENLNISLTFETAS
jgi:hypothetical protein